MSDSVRPPGFSRQEHCSGSPFPSPMHESEKWKWSRWVMADSSRPHGLQPSRLLRPWDFPGKSTGVGCQCHIPIFRWENWDSGSFNKLPKITQWTTCKGRKFSHCSDFRAFIHCVWPFWMEENEWITKWCNCMFRPCLCTQENLVALLIYQEYAVFRIQVSCIAGGLSTSWPPGKPIADTAVTFKKKTQRTNRHYLNNG